jgi:hypothetical protein
VVVSLLSEPLCISSSQISEDVWCRVARAVGDESGRVTGYSILRVGKRSGSGDKRQSPTLKPVVMWIFFIKLVFVCSRYANGILNCTDDV